MLDETFNVYTTKDPIKLEDKTENKKKASKIIPVKSSEGMIGDLQIHDLQATDTTKPIEKLRKISPKKKFA